MPTRDKIREIIYLLVLLVLLIGLPLAILAYDRQLKPGEDFGGRKEFVLTGNAEQGWLLGEVPSYGIISLWKKSGPPKEPVRFS